MFKRLRAQRIAGRLEEEAAYAKALALTGNKEAAADKHLQLWARALQDEQEKQAIDV